jgi:hypothetical protein
MMSSASVAEDRVGSEIAGLVADSRVFVADIRRYKTSMEIKLSFVPA